MDFLYAHFPISGVETWIFVPPLVAFVISFFYLNGWGFRCFFVTSLSGKRAALYFAGSQRNQPVFQRNRNT